MPILSFLGHDFRVEERLFQLSEEAEQIKKKEELVALVREVRNEPLTYRFLPFFKLFRYAILLVWALITIAASLALFFLAIVVSGNLDWNPVIVFLALVTLPIAIAKKAFKFLKREISELEPFYSFSRRWRTVNETSKAIHHQSCLIANGLVRIDARQLEHTPMENFTSLELGDPISRDFQTLAIGQHSGTEHHFDYLYFSLKYEIRQDKKLVEKNRYGLMLHIPYMKNVSLRQKTMSALVNIYPAFSFGHLEKWKSPSLTFNRKFITLVESQQEASSFFRPHILKEIEALNEGLNNLEIEINKNGGLCLSCDDADIVDNLMMYHLNMNEEFQRELTNHKPNKKLKNLLNFIHTLMKYSDNNFDQSTITQTNTNLKTGSTA